MEPTNRATVNIFEVRKSRRPTNPNILAEVRLEIKVGGHVIGIDDAKVLRNRQGQEWLALPSYSITTPGSRDYSYFPSVVLDHDLQLVVEDLALEAYRKHQQPGKRALDLV
jgi:hypothetical protein